MKFIYIFFTLVLLSSCQEEEKILKPIKNIEFKNSLNANYRFGGTFKEKDSTIVFFADITTKKKIYFHNAKGKLIDSVSFYNPKLLDDEYNTLNFINRDTFFIGNKFNIIALNRECKIIKKITRDSLLKNEPYKYHFHFSTALHGKQLKEKLYVNLDWRGKKGMNIEDFNQKYKDYSFSNPNLLYINNFFTDSLQYTMLPHNFYTYLFDKSGYFGESLKLFYEYGKYIISSDFSNELLILNQEFKTIKINSNFASTYKKPLLSNWTNHNGATVLKIFYSKNRNQYITVFRQSIDSSITEFKRFRPFSVIILDENFKKINEKAILDDSHQPYRSFYIEEQDILLIQKNTKNEDKNIFSTFSF